MKLLSWNIQWGRGADGEVSLARTVAAIRLLGDFDVICLQEVAVGFPAMQGGARVDALAFFAQAFPAYSAHFAAAVDMPGADAARSLFGNLILSRLPVGQVFPQQSSEEGISDWGLDDATDRSWALSIPNP